MPGTAQNGGMPVESSRPDRPTAAPARRGEFLLVSCLPGAEGPLVARQAEVCPELHKAAWRRGVVTFRLPAGLDPPDDFWPDLVFGRACVRSLGQVTGADDAGRAAAAAALAGAGPWDAIHVWPRTSRVETDVPAISQALAAAVGPPRAAAGARPGDLVLDCLVDSPDRWWIGWHRAARPPSTWPGGGYPGALPECAVSRAWLKLDEGLAAFEIPLEPGATAVELGAAPGGASQRLLEAGLEVVGIDPAAVDARVAAAPRFRQWRKRSRDVKLREFRSFDWIVCDMNIDPRGAMAELGRIVTAPGVRPRGILATLKLPDWSRAAELGGWLDAFRGWGFEPRARQLSTAGREVFVAALRGGVSRRSTRRPAP
jgi:23S rRNA (cytidine2498-2'-O)-methyltransferase